MNLSATYQVAREANPMALDKDALSDLLDALRCGGDLDQGRRSGVAHPQAATEIVLPLAAGAARRIDRALWAVVMEAYVHGVSTRKVDDLVKALGIDAGISKSEVSRICSELDEQVGAFRDRSLRHRRRRHGVQLRGGRHTDRGENVGAPV